MCQEKRFREELYYRINVVDIEIPPLREYREDIPLLADYFIKKISQQYGGLYSQYKLSSAAVEVLKKYHWPGNVGQLENIIRKTLIAKGGQAKHLIEPEDIELAKDYKQKVVKKLDEQRDALTKENRTNCLGETNKKKSWFSELDRDKLINLCRDIWMSKGNIITNAAKSL